MAGKVKSSSPNKETTDFVIPVACWATRLIFYRPEGVILVSRGGVVSNTVASSYTQRYVWKGLSQLGYIFVYDKRLYKDVILAKKCETKSLAKTVTPKLSIIYYENGIKRKVHKNAGTTFAMGGSWPAKPAYYNKLEVEALSPSSPPDKTRWSSVLKFGNILHLDFLFGSVTNWSPSFRTFPWVSFLFLLAVTVVRLRYLRRRCYYLPCY